MFECYFLLTPESNLTKIKQKRQRISNNNNDNIKLYSNIQGIGSLVNWTINLSEDRPDNLESW